MNEKMVKDIIPGAFEGKGIFSAFVNPVWCYDFDPAELDLCFITTYGEKWASPFLSHFDAEGGISDADLAKVASTIYRVHKSQWEHLYKASQADYNPIYNTFVDEVETFDKAGSENVINGATNEDTSKSNVNTEADSTNENLKQGFNSGSYQGDTKSTGDTDAATDSNGLTGSAAENTSLKNYGDLETRTFRKEGNIGTVTAADLIKADREAWQWSYILGVMRDISDMIALSIY